VVENLLETCIAHCVSNTGVFLIVGNCAQLGPVMPGADAATQIAYSIIKAQAFDTFQHFRLTGQMRMRDRDLRNAIHAIGYGTWPTSDGTTHLRRAAQKIRMPLHLFPAFVATDDTIKDLRTWVHGHVNDFNGSLNGAIVCSTNARAEEHNLEMLHMLDGEAKIYLCRDEVVPVRDGDQPFESANISSDASRAFNDSSMPPAELQLKVRIMFSIKRRSFMPSFTLSIIDMVDPPVPAIRGAHLESQQLYLNMYLKYSVF
jgi:hypothetical protein